MIFSNENFKSAFAKVLPYIVMLAVILSGSSLWLKRVGIIEHDQYKVLAQEELFFENKLNEYLANPDNFSESKLQEYKNNYKAHRQKVRRFIYSVDPSFYLFKFSKIIALVLVISLAMLYLNNLSVLVREKAVILLLLNTVIASIISFNSFGWRPIASSVYLYATFLIIWLSSSFATNQKLKNFSQLGFYSLTFLLVAALVEFFLGLPIFSSGALIDKRAVSFLNQPNTLGIYTVFIMAFYFSLNSINSNGPVSFFCIASALILVFLSGSNTAAILLPLCFLNFFSEKARLTRANFNYRIKLILALSIFIALIVLTHRFALDSLLGRFEKYEFYFAQEKSIFNTLFGYGIGIGSNSLLLIDNYLDHIYGPKIGPINFSTDSTPLTLLIQIGLIGFLAFYWIIFKAMIYDKDFRSIYLLVLLSSFSINILEIFPFNVILGLMIAKSLAAKQITVENYRK